MSIQREFLDWRSPALAGAVQFLRTRCERDGTLELSQFIIVVPGGRAGRRLLEILVESAESNKVILTPPQIVTPEKFPELLYEAKWPFADTLTQQLAWAEALRTAPPATLKSYLPFPPDPTDWPRWLAVGETLRKLHVELAADGLDCSEVLKGAQTVEGFGEDARWKALCELQRLYLDTLHRLKLWDVQTARLVAIKQHEIATDKQIVLLGTVDLNRAQRQMLDQIADRVTALVVAPPDIADRFDSHGCLVPARWTRAELPLADEQIERVDGPAEQAETVTRWLASLGGYYRADQIVIGLPDEKLAPQIQRQLAQCGLVGRWAIGRQLAETAPYRLLKAAAGYAARRRYRDLAALVRHPDVYDWLQEKAREKGDSEHVDLLAALDQYASDHFPAQLEEQRLIKDEHGGVALFIYQEIEQLIQPLVGEPEALADWAGPLRSVLTTIYGQRMLNREDLADRYLTQSLEHLSKAIDNLSQVPSELQATVDARQACRIVLGELSGVGLPPPVADGAIEMLGWLDLSLDDSPATIVTTFNDGLVPGSTTADAFLPNRLRESLGLVHNDRRLARDAYALAVLLASRRDVKLVVAHRDTEGNPLAPSRLLFLTDQDRLVHRALRFFGDLRPQSFVRRNLLLPPDAPPPRSRLSPPRPQRLAQPIGELSVTKFRDYIACPYRFYLRHVLALEALADDAEELDGGAFGDLAHFVLEQFGRARDAKDVRVSSDPKKIVEYLDYQLDRVTVARFGAKHVRPAVLVQIEQLRLRLAAFAQWQAARAADGWRIVFSEDSESRRMLLAPLEVDGQDFVLRGRIDRIDFHEVQGRLAVLDYKTADRGDGPDRAHRRGEDWIDLQLPLYRHLVRAAKFTARVPADAPISLGYIVLPLDLKCVGLARAEWDDALLLSADIKAFEVIRGIRQQTFWPPASPPPDFFDDVAAICQDRRMGTAASGPDGEAA